LAFLNANKHLIVLGTVKVCDLKLEVFVPIRLVIIEVLHGVNERLLG
jgi:hypothetical protein